MIESAIKLVKVIQDRNILIESLPENSPERRKLEIDQDKDLVELNKIVNKED